MAYRMKNLMKNFFNIFTKNRKKNSSDLYSNPNDKKEISTIEMIEQSKVDIKKIKIENYPFRLSGLLHILTNRISNVLQEQGHTIYYDVENEVGRYIIGDNDYIEQILEILVKDGRCHDLLYAQWCRND
jgi:hypothetical protein